MTDKPVRQPSAEHPITVTATGEHVTVRVNGQVVADSDAALTLQESIYPAVQYIPMSDVEAGVLTPSDTATYCPYKGDASYFHVTVGERTVEDVIWTYAHPYAAVGDIAGHAAFYPDKAEIILG